MYFVGGVSMGYKEAIHFIASTRTNYTEADLRMCIANANARFQSQCTWKRQMKDQKGVIWHGDTDLSIYKVVKRVII